MKKHVMAQICQLLETVNEVHKLICDSLKDRQISDAVAFLGDCQEAANAISTIIIEEEGGGTALVLLLEEYCQLLHGIHERLLAGEEMNPAKLYKTLNKRHIRISNSLVHDIKVKKEVIFLPYKASMWDSLESVWRAAADDPDCDAYVIPIPYYDKDSDGSLLELHYEGAEFPADVPIVHYDDYAFAENHPDIIFIHNPYDDGNRVTTVHPFFYSKNLKKYTDKLVYIPYFVLAEPDRKNVAAVEALGVFVQVSAVVNADVVVVQSEDMRLCYIEAMVKLAGEKSRKHWSGKILGIGSPKFDKVMSTAVVDGELPEEWKKILTKTDGSWKKVILYNTTVVALLPQPDLMLAKIENVLAVFAAMKEDVTLLWRPHPLMEATIKSMRPAIWAKYQILVETYKQSGWGIFDGSADLNRAIAMADAYYGDPSSLVELCQKVGMPIMIQNPHVTSA